ncbi:MAG: hypothetical protein ACM3JC_00525 [Rudaea sp.]
MSATNRTVPEWGKTIGWVDEPRSEGILSGALHVAGWALSTAGIRAVEVRIGARVLRARYGLPRHDVAAVRAGYPDNPRSGFALSEDLSGDPAPPGIDRRTLEVVAIAGDGTEVLLGRRSLVEAAVHARWSFVERGPSAPFYLVPATSGVSAGGATGLEAWYAAHVSSTAQIGMRVPILYLRTTAGAAGDYRFDPQFDVARTSGARPVADDALAPVLAHARAHRLPVLVTLNGGIWADASGTCPEWDVNDRLEEDVANCQWNERGEVMPDDCLKHLPGSQQAPELARALTLNVYARTVRAYKRRNLQQAARHVVAFLRDAPDLLIGVNLDPDVYINPFFGEAQWYDYNPGTLAQFRHWLAGTGPYAGDVRGDVPDLSRYRRAAPLTLAEISALARRPFASLDDVDPPRTFPREPGRAYWNDPWMREWEHFRRHLVALHYDELARWLVEAGVPRDRIWSSQGLMAPDGDALPLALSLTSPVKNHDSGGVTIEGSKPRDGHLGAIVYGAAATNEMPMENGRALYSTLASVDPDFAIVEFNTADLRHPERRPTYAQAYRALRDLWNAGARFVSPMAWNGSNGLHADSDEYVTFTAWRNTPLEEAARDFLLARSGLPRGSRLWTFGTQVHADDDGFTIDAGAMRALRGALELTADDGGRVALLSPPDLALAATTIESFVVGLEDVRGDATLEVDARPSIDAPWAPIARSAVCRARRTAAGLLLPASLPAVPDARDVGQMRIAIALAPRAHCVLCRVAILRRTQPN